MKQKSLSFLVSRRRLANALCCLWRFTPVILSTLRHDDLSMK
tara:strand:- start:294 stop:419 length:126 start_codon:yes stop_codon:yes gene_type:complete